MKGKRPAEADIDLGLAVSALSLKQGETRSCADIAKFCGVSRGAIEKIERRALIKLRRRMDSAIYLSYGG